MDSRHTLKCSCDPKSHRYTFNIYKCEHTSDEIHFLFNRYFHAVLELALAGRNLCDRLF